MGIFHSAQKEEVKTLLIGLDRVGKTSILYKLKLNQSVDTTPTMGFNIETISYKNINYNMWDIGGTETFQRNMWNTYAKDVKALIFIIDSTDRQRIDLAISELERIASSEWMQNLKILVLANKQDVANCLTVNEIKDKLELRTISQQYFVQPCCALSGYGLYERLDWLSTQ